MHWHCRQAGTVIAIGVLMGALGLSAAAQQSSCSPDTAIDHAGMKTLSNLQVSSWAGAPVAKDVSLATALRDFNIDISKFTTGTEVPLVLPGHVETSVFVLEREVQGQPLDHTWVVLYSVAPPAVRQAMEQQGIRYPWNGFVMNMDGNAAAPIRIGMLGQPDSQLVYDPQRHTFVQDTLPLLSGLRKDEGCVSCILDLVKSVVCEAVADGISCATVAGCPGAVLSALLRATFKLVTGDLCFLGDINSCANSCGLQQIRITPESNAQLNRGAQKITVNTLSGKNVGAWAMAVRQDAVLGTPIVTLGTSNQQTLNWNPRIGVYTIYAGNIPVPAFSIPGLARSTNVNVGQSPTVAVSWRITDSCDDGRGFRVRFFDKTRGGAYPASGYDTVPSGGEQTFTMNVPRGSMLCEGAVQDPPTDSYWCYGIDGGQNADYPGAGTCCYQVPTSGTTLAVGSTLIGP
jgi:hypothetical protein